MRGAHNEPHRSHFGKLPTLRRRRDFVRVQTQGRRFRKHHLVVLLAPNTVDHARVGITVSRKVGNAVTRNRVRRRIRELLRAHMDLLSACHDHVVVAYPSAAQTTFATLREELTCLLERALDSVLAQRS
ncbi:MAG: ribonuclease P protein component [Myxococcota bacterium]